MRNIDKKIKYKYLLFKDDYICSTSSVLILFYDLKAVNLAKLNEQLQFVYLILFNTILVALTFCETVFYHYVLYL